MLRYLLFTISALFIVQCSKISTPEQPVHISILDEIPERIKKVENLTIFPGNAIPSHSIKLTLEQEFGDIGEPYLVSILASVVDERGRVIILNVGSDYEQVLYVFNADGTYHTQLGRQGKGPGEYGHIVGMQAIAEKIFVLDFTSLRLNEYSMQGYSFIRSILLEKWQNKEGTDIGYVNARNDGNYLVQFSDEGPKFGRQKDVFWLMDDEGNAINTEPIIFPAGFTIRVRQAVRPTMPLTFMGKTITALSKNDALYTAWTRDFLIKKYDANGVYQSSIYYPITGAPFDLKAYTQAEFFSPKARDIEKAFSDMDKKLPETFPVIDKLLVDDENRVWVAVPISKNNEIYEWWILQESGELLAKLLLSKDQPIYDIKDGYLYSKETNEETGAEYAVRYRIEFTER